MHLRYILFVQNDFLPYKVYLFFRLFIRNSERLAASNSSNSSSYYSFIFKWLQQQMPNIIFLQIHIIQVECVWLEVTAWGGLAMLSISCNVFTIIHIYVFSGMTGAYMTIACSPTQESTMVSVGGTIMTLNLDIIGRCIESILIVMVEEDMVSLSAWPRFNCLLIRFINISYRFNLLNRYNIATCETVLSRQILFNGKNSSAVWLFA